MTKNFFVRTATAGIAALVLCGSAVADTWRVATEGTFPPFEFYNSTTGEIQGFEVDLVREMAKVMKKGHHSCMMTLRIVAAQAGSRVVVGGCELSTGFGVSPCFPRFADPGYLTRFLASAARLRVFVFAHLDLSVR